ncbi:hypothetical protein [Chryseobacterium sp. POE27]|uniref:hypothetical protein n=1 Tax=Chryseobacterium sp. POE27 TaxID=3138177 RepID=UPI00321AD56C
MAIKVKSPSSYFFTESDFNQAPTDKAFGPIDNNRFQITTTFAQSLKAYAVTGGVLLIAKQAGATNRINIFLKPTQEIGLGIKIKYFVYRGIDATDYFKDVSGTVLINENSNLNFITKAWDAYVEFNQTTADFTADKTGVIDGSGGLNKELIKKYFSTETYNLLKVSAGTPLGKFVANAGGFEIVLDEGDYSQDSSDTGLNFDLSFIVANSTILTTKDSSTANLPNVFGTQSNTALDAKIFRENIYKFLDPAAFYGSHITDNNDNKGAIRIAGISTPYSSKSSIYTNIINKFINKFKTYVYVKGIRNRSLNFYDTNNKIKINAAEQDISSPKWPIIIFAGAQINLEITNSNLTGSAYSSTYFDNAGYLVPNFLGIKNIVLPFVADSGANKIICSFTYIFYNANRDQSELLFGLANLNSIFEREDFTNKQGAVVNFLGYTLKKESENVGAYNLKIILEGYIADSDPINIPTDPNILSKTLRTYILFPQESNVELSSSNKGNLTAGYFDSIKDSSEYCKNIYGEGDIWRGQITDSSVGIFSLLYRRNDEGMPIYQLGISQLDYKTLIDDINTNHPNATNMFFSLENEIIGTGASFFKVCFKDKI